MSNEIPNNVPGLDLEQQRNIDQDAPIELPWGYVLVKGIPTKQTLKVCPRCFDPRIRMEATAEFRLTNQHIWALSPITQEELIEVLNQDDNKCYCSNSLCEWVGTFGELEDLDSPPISK